MSALRVEIQSIQHIASLALEVDLAHHRVVCIAGKNGSGKTTLVKALKNLASADTFNRTSSAAIFTPASKITYEWEGERVEFAYDPAIRSLNCRSPISRKLRTLVAAELPMPHGERFNYFRSITEADLDIRRAIVLGEFSAPIELIQFLTSIYGPGKFERLVQIDIGKNQYFCILLEGARYVREDYFSSGEYFLLSLYKRLRSDSSLVVVDEIDISLDPAAQVRLVEQLRIMCDRYGRSVLCTTHSLAMLKTMLPGEILYMEHDSSRVTLTPLSYSYVKSILFGFRGWDRYILTEDDVLQRFLEHIIANFCGPRFFSHKIIYIGGAQNVVNLMRRNASEGFLGGAGSVVAVLDGDQSHLRAGRTEGTLCIPVQSVEKALHAYYRDASFAPRLNTNFDEAAPKVLFRELARQRLMSEAEIFELICDRERESITAFAARLSAFLNGESADVSRDPAGACVGVARI